MRGRQQSNTKSFMRRSATPWMLVASFPRVKTLGYHRTSLREERQLRFPVVLRRMRPVLPHADLYGPVGPNRKGIS